MDTQISESLEYLKLRIISPREKVFDDLALSISSQNSAGKFDILPQHANFITLIQNQPITVRKRNKEIQTFNFPLAIIYATHNTVNIYTDIQFKG